MTLRSNGISEFDQKDIRGWFGGDPNSDGLPDHGVHNGLMMKGKLRGDNYRSADPGKAKYIWNSMLEGKSVNISRTGKPIGYSISVEGIYQKVVTKVNGSVSLGSHWSYRIFDPARSNPYHLGAQAIKSRLYPNVFSYWR